MLKNIDLWNKFNLLENKIDIINTTLNLKKYIRRDMLNYNEIKKNITNILYELKQEVVSHLNISNTQMIYGLDVLFNDHIECLFSKMDDLYNENGDINVYNSVKSIEEKIGHIYYENEIIKHQLSLGDEIRKIGDTITTLENDIHTKIKEIDELILRK